MRRGDVLGIIPSIKGVKNTIIEDTEKGIVDDSKLRHTINIDINQINPFYDLLCPLIDIHLLYNKSSQGGGGFIEDWKMKIFNKTILIDDDLGSNVLPITKEVNEYFVNPGGTKNLHPYFDTKRKNIINEDCGFNEVIVNRIIRKYLEDKNYLQDKLIEIKDFSLGFIPSEKSGNKLPIKSNTGYGCKYTLIDMEKCGVKINFAEETEPENIKTVNNLSDLMIESLNYINNSDIEDKPTKRKGFLKNVIEKLLFGRKEEEVIGFDQDNDNIGNIIEEIFKNSEKINILQIIDNLKELEGTLPANYNGYSFFGLLLELRENLGFIHGDLKTGNVFIRYTKEAANNTVNPTVLTFKINDPKDPENYGILNMIECIVADLDKARLQVPMDTIDRII